MRLKSILVAAALCLAPCAVEVHADLSDGLVAYFPFSGSADDASGNGHDGTVYGATPTADRFGNPGSAYSFDGFDDYVSVPYAGAFDSTTFTLSAWICPSKDLAPGSDAAIITARGEDFETDRLWSSLEIVGEDNEWGSGATLLYEDAGDTERVYDTGYFPGPGAWTHIAATRSLDGDVSVYIDGALIGLWQGTPAPAMCTQCLTIGARYWSPSTSGPYVLAGFFAGTIDEVCVYNRALSADEILQLAQVEICATVNITPDTLDLKNRGKWITAYIGLPEGYDIDDIDVDNVLLEGLLDVQRSDIQDGVLMAKFDTEDLKAYLEVALGIVPPADVELVVTGELNNGTVFTGSDTIRVMDSGKT